jgi:hypothetical protein
MIDAIMSMQNGQEAFVGLPAEEHKHGGQEVDADAALALQMQ